MPKTKKQIEKTQSMMGGRVMERIHAEHVSPVPASVFLFHNILLGTAISLSTLFGILFTSITIFKLSSIHVFGNAFMFQHIPWFSGGIALCSLLVTFALLEYYKVFYKLSLVTLFTSVAVVIFMIAFLFNKTTLHTRLSQSRVGGIYGVEEKPMMVYAGRALEVRTQKAFLLETLRGETIHMYVPEDTRLPESGIKQGQSIFVAGYYQNGRFIVKGIISLGKPQA